MRPRWMALLLAVLIVALVALLHYVPAVDVFVVGLRPLRVVVVMLAAWLMLLVIVGAIFSSDR